MNKAPAVSTLPRQNICFVVSSPMTATSFLLNHFAKLSAHFDITLVANFNHAESSTGISDKIAIETIHLPISRDIAIYSDLKNLISLLRLFRKREFIAVHSVTPKAGLITMTAAFIARVPRRFHIFTGQVWVNETGIKRKLLACLDRLTHACSTISLVDGHPQRQFLIAHKVIREKYSRVLGAGSISGVDTEKFQPRGDRHSELKDDLGIAQASTLFVFLGRITPDKGLLDLFAAFTRLQSESGSACLLIIGPIEDSTVGLRIEQLRQQLPKNFFYIDFTRTPEKLLPDADIFCLPSYREGFGTSVLEAAACGLPAIGSDIYGLRDTIVDNETGLFHRAGNVDDLYDQMKRLHEDPNLAREMGVNAQRRAHTLFSQQAITGDWVDFYLAQAPSQFQHQ